MEHYRKLINKFTCELGMHSQNDGFPSAELRGRILMRLANLRLPGNEVKQVIHPQMDTEAICRLNFLMQARKIGAEVTQAFAREEFAILSSHYLFGGILAGAELIGREIARGYAVELYPELKRLRDMNIELPIPAPAKNMTELQEVFGFTIKTNPYFIDVGEIEKMAPDTGWRISHDELGENYHETFTFHTLEDAEENRKQWIRFRDNESRSSPVIYCICVETTSDGTITVGEISHLASEEDGAVWHHDDGTASELFTFVSLEDAIKQRRELEDKVIFDSTGQGMDIDGFPENASHYEIPLPGKPAPANILNQEINHATHALRK